MARNYSERRYNRYVKGMRRVKVDRMEHGEPWYNHGGELRISCDCFEDEVTKGRGATFARFADTPKSCSSWCCGNRRSLEGPTVQERRAPTIKEFEYGD